MERFWLLNYVLMLNWIVGNRTICIKMDVALNNLQRLMRHKTQPTNLLPPLNIPFALYIIWTHAILQPIGFYNTYQYLESTLSHIMSNLIVLISTGNISKTYISAKQKHRRVHLLISAVPKDIEWTLTKRIS